MITTIDRSERALQNISLHSHYLTEEETEVQVHDVIYQDATSGHCQSGN